MSYLVEISLETFMMAGTAPVIVAVLRPFSFQTMYGMVAPPYMAGNWNEPTVPILSSNSRTTYVGMIVPPLVSVMMRLRPSTDSDAGMIEIISAESSD